MLRVARLLLRRSPVQRSLPAAGQRGRSCALAAGVCQRRLARIAIPGSEAAQPGTGSGPARRLPACRPPAAQAHKGTQRAAAPPTACASNHARTWTRPRPCVLAAKGCPMAWMCLHGLQLGARKTVFGPAGSCCASEVLLPGICARALRERCCDTGCPPRARAPPDRALGWHESSAQQVAVD